MSAHFITQLFPGKGPDPKDELEYLVRECEQEGRVLFGSQKPGSGWKETDGASFLVVFYKIDEEKVDGCVGRILHRSTPRSVPELYAPWTKAMKGWWVLKDVRRFREDVTLDDIPGKSEKREPAAARFKGQVAFVYWSFDEDPSAALCPSMVASSSSPSDEASAPETAVSEP